MSRIYFSDHLAGLACVSSHLSYSSISVSDIKENRQKQHFLKLQAKQERELVTAHLLKSCSSSSTWTSSWTCKTYRWWRNLILEQHRERGILASFALHRGASRYPTLGSPSQAHPCSPLVRDKELPLDPLPQAGTGSTWARPGSCSSQQIPQVQEPGNIWSLTQDEAAQGSRGVSCQGHTHRGTGSTTRLKMPFTFDLN